jgi:hypothetical protein
MSKGPDSALKPALTPPCSVSFAIPSLLNYEGSQAVIDVMAEPVSGRVCEKCCGTGWADNKKTDSCPKCLGYGMYKPKS